MGVTKLVCGVGDNDISRPTFEWVNGKRVYDAYYRTWKSMLTRCYWKGRDEVHMRCYDNVQVAESWLKFSSFENWMKTQDHVGKVLDKDILSSLNGNKEYSPDTCAFISQNLNAFVMGLKNKHTDYPLGVSFHKRDEKYAANIAYRGKQKWLGYYTTPEEAHNAWQVAKYNYGVELMNEQTDVRVKEALRKILSNLKYQYENGIITESLLKTIDTPSPTVF